MSDNYRHTRENMNIEQLRKLVEKEEIDYQLLLSALSEYRYPRDKISGWLKSGDLVRVKKGLYVFGNNAALTAYSKEILANLIYGPSVISLEYALSYYGFIPERTITLTSITNKRDKSFSTPIGDFTYRYINQKKYPVGIEIMQTSITKKFFMASPEKALSDHIHLVDKHLKLTTTEEIESYLLYDLRIDEHALSSLRLNRLNEISKIYQDVRLKLLSQFIKQWKKK